jgi:sensor histidine kinase regulating citrate/malate metabolism
MQGADTVKFMRHDMRHHLTLMGELALEDAAKLQEYIRGLSEKLDVAEGKRYCTNYAVNAITTHYLGVAEKEGVAVDAQLGIPEDTGRVPAMDLCVIMGNLLENAVEACRRVERGEKFIQARGRIIGDGLSIVVTNSFDGVWREKNDVYLSRKADEGEPCEGVGLSSVKAVSEKYRGLIQYEITGGVWKSSVLVHI